MQLYTLYINYFMQTNENFSRIKNTKNTQYPFSLQLVRLFFDESEGSSNVQTLYP